jgi:FkbM family methyltransferase
MFFFKIFSIIRFIIKHPLSKNRKFNSLLRFIIWQISSTLFIKKFCFKWIDDSILIAYKGEAAITGNLYTGLMDFNDMAFLLHYLNRKDVFVDVGANTGVYTVLASKVIGSKSISIEPIKKSFKRIKENLKINKIEHLVSLYNCGIGKKKGKLFFTSENDSNNRIVDKKCNEPTSLCKIKTLNSILNKNNFYVLKIDTEGFEYNVLKGANKFLKKGNITALIVELNGSGKAYGFTDNVVHNELLSYGYFPICYNPFFRTIKKKRSIKFDTNIIYVKDIFYAKKKISQANSRTIHSAQGARI